MATPSSYTEETILVHGGQQDGDSLPVPTSHGELARLIRKVEAARGTVEFVPSVYVEEVP